MQPRSVAVDTKTGCVAVVDTALHRVQVNKTITKIVKLLFAFVSNRVRYFGVGFIEF